MRKMMIVACVIVLLGFGCLPDVPVSTPQASTQPTEPVLQQEMEPTPAELITGRVVYVDTDIPVPGVTIVTGYASGQGTTDVTDKEGRFEITPLYGVSSQEIYLASTTHVVGDGTVRVSPGSDVTLFAYPTEALRPDESTVVLVEPSYQSSTETGVEIVVRDRTTNAVLPNASVVFERMVIQECTKPTNSDGLYRCTSTSPGVYRVYSPEDEAPTTYYQFSIVEGFLTRFEMVLE